MLNTKILAAVLGSLAVLGATANGGAQPLSMNSFSLGNLGDLELTPRSIGAFAGIIDEQKPDTRIRASLSVNGSFPQEIEVDSASLTLEEVKRLSTSGRTIQSDSKIKLNGVDGTVTVGNPVKISGEASGVLTSGVNISESFSIENEFNTTKLVVKDIRGSEIKFENVNGVVSSGTTTATISENSRMMIDVFQGDMSINTETKNINITGKVANMDAGPVGIG